MNSWRQALGRNGDLVLVGMVVSILLILFTPIPSALLDLLILTNFAFALTILLLTFYVARPVDFSTFPSLLLVATLFRLALNVAATRLILSGAEAGQVIAAVGAFVVQGNFVIGLIVFLILIIVQYVVVTNGAQRVSEVAARFVLDGMPGQQMSIDADLNMGLIDQDEAKARRKGLEQVASFYGAMDGASKFVKGDAIAGVIILLVNIVGGLVVGATQMGMRWDEAMRTFTLLTIGDGIVTQVPALVIAVATGIIVTRSASDRELSSEVVRQLLQFPRVQLIVLVALAGLMLLPGLPMWPFPLLALLGVPAYWLSRRRRAEAEAAGTTPEAAAAGGAAQGADADVKPPPPVEVRLGEGLLAAWGNVDATLAERMAAFRRQTSEDYGLVMPAVVFRPAPRLAANDYEILVTGGRVGRGSIQPEHTLAIHTSPQAPVLRGTPTRDPAFGLPGVWIAATERDAARQAGYAGGRAHRAGDAPHRVPAQQRLSAAHAGRGHAPAGRRAHTPARPAGRAGAHGAGRVRRAARAAEPAVRDGQHPPPRPHRGSAGRRRPHAEGPHAADRTGARAPGPAHLPGPAWQPGRAGRDDAGPQPGIHADPGRACAGGSPGHAAGTAPGRADAQAFAQHRRGHDAQQPDAGAAVQPRAAPPPQGLYPPRRAAPGCALGVRGAAGH